MFYACSLPRYQCLVHLCEIIASVLSSYLLLLASISIGTYMVELTQDFPVLYVHVADHDKLD